MGRFEAPEGRRPARIAMERLALLSAFGRVRKNGEESGASGGAERNGGAEVIICLWKEKKESLKFRSVLSGKGATTEILTGEWRSCWSGVRSGRERNELLPLPKLLLEPLRR